MKKGVDVSTFQKVVDWQEVKRLGYEFAIVKATQGHSVTNANLYCFTDSRFKANIVGAAKAGLMVGVYHYFTAQSDDEVVEEANHFIETIKPYKDKIALWAAVDVEDAKFCGVLDKQALTHRVRMFMNLVEKAGFRPMLYTNPNYLKYKFLSGAFDKANIWLAHWGVSRPMPVKNMMIWQYGTVKIGGVAFDANYGYFDELEAIKAAIEKGSTVKIIQGAKYKAPGRDADGVNVPFSVRSRKFTVVNVARFGDNDYALLDKINSWVALRYLETV